MVLEGFLLGLSMGSYCIMSCAPVFLPFIFSEEVESFKKSLLYTLLFLLGRLISYVFVGFILGLAGSYLLKYIEPELERNLGRIAFGLSGIILLAGGLLYNFPEFKLCKIIKKVYKPEISSLILGLATGFTLCPPFFAAASRVFIKGSGLDGIIYFFLFYLGTSIYFLPFFGIHILKNKLREVRIISRMVMILIGFYFFFVLGILGW